MVMSNEIKNSQTNMVEFVKDNRTLIENIKDGNETVAKMVKNKEENDGYRINLPIHKESDDIERYLEQYERITAMHKWNDQKKASRLVPLLSGKARDAYLKLSAEDVADYAKLKDAILQEYQRTSEYYRSQFRNAVKEESENFKQFADRLERLSDQWLLMEKVTQFRELLELTRLETFYTSLSKELAVHVREKKPQTLKEAAQCAFEYVENRKAVSMNKKFGEPKQGFRHIDTVNDKMPNDKKPLHERYGLSEDELAELRRERKCFRCKGNFQRGHQCPTGEVGGRFLSIEDTIFQDGESQTTDVRRVEIDGDRKSEGAAHPNPLWKDISSLCKECESVKWQRCIDVKVNDQIVTALRDTGADDIIISPSLVRESDYLPQKTRVKLAVANVQGIYPRALIDLESPFIRGKVQCVVVDGVSPKVFIGEQATRENGKIERIPVYPQQSLMAIQTRVQAKRDRKKPNPREVVRVEGLDVSKHELTELQKSDETLEWARQQAELKQTKTGKNRRKISFMWKDGILTRKFKKGKKVKTQVVVPKSLRAKVVQTGHDMPLAGHMERTRHEFDAELSCRDQSISKLQDQVHLMQGDLDNRIQQKDQLERELHKKNVDLSASQTHVSRLEQAEKNLKEQMKSLEQQLLKEKGQWMMEADELERKLGTQSADLDSALAKISDLKQTIREMQEEDRACDKERSALDLALEQEKIYHANMLKQFYENGEVGAVSVVSQVDEDQDKSEVVYQELPVIPLKQTETFENVKFGEVKEVVEPMKVKVAERTRILTDLPLLYTLEEGVIEQDIAGPVKKFEPYIYGRQYVVQSDHQPLVWLSNVKGSNKRLMRWALCLQDQNIIFQAIPGNENQGADFLSRM